MRTVFAFILKFIAFILALSTVFATTFGLLFLSFNRILINPQSYEQAFIENKVYERIPSVTAEEFTLIKSHLVEPCAASVIADSCLDSNANTPLPGNSTENGRLRLEGSTFINGLNEDQWKSLVLYLLTPEDIQKVLNAGADEIVIYFKGEKNTVGFPLLNLKARLSGLTEEEVSRLLLSSQPLCTLEQQTTIMSGGLAEAGSLPILCSANAKTSLVVVLDLQRRLNILAGELPEQVTIIKSPSPLIPPILQRIIGKDLQATLQNLQDNAQYIPFLPVAFLLLATLFSVRSLRGLLRWWSIPIFIGGLLTLIIGGTLYFLFNQIWLNYAVNRLSPLLTSGFGDLIFGVGRSLSKDVSQHLMIQATITSVLALVILILSNRVPAPPDPSLPPLAPPGTPGGPVLNPSPKKKKW